MEGLIGHGKQDVNHLIRFGDKTIDAYEPSISRQCSTNDGNLIAATPPPSPLVCAPSSVISGASPDLMKQYASEYDEEKRRGARKQVDQVKGKGCKEEA